MFFQPYTFGSLAHFSLSPRLLCLFTPCLLRQIVNFAFTLYLLLTPLVKVYYTDLKTRRISAGLLGELQAQSGTE